MHPSTEHTAPPTHATASALSFSFINMITVSMKHNTVLMKTSKFKGESRITNPIAHKLRK